MDTARDVQHCGACETACGPSEFCTGTACEASAWTHVCDNPLSTILLDDLDGDQAAATSIQDALGQLCTAPGYQVRAVDPQNVAVIDLNTGRPLTRGGELLIAPGGSFRQKLVDYLESQGITNPYDRSTLDEVTLATRDGGVIVDVPVSTVSDTHDYFILELVREPIRGSLSDAPPSEGGCGFRNRCPAAFARCDTDTPQLRPTDPARTVACHLGD